jgi:WD40 repeat protein
LENHTLRQYPTKGREVKAAAGSSQLPAVDVDEICTFEQNAASDDFFKSVACTLPSTNGGKNVLCVAVVDLPAAGKTAVLCGGADGSLNGWDARSGAQLFSCDLRAPVLCVDAALENRSGGGDEDVCSVCCGTMDGHVYVVSLADWLVVWLFGCQVVLLFS